MLKPKLLATTCILLLMLGCSHYRMYVRVASDFGSTRHQIDTIAIISDALVLVDAKDDFYSVNASRVLDSLLLYGASKALTKRGYIR